jgi:hypothetical protein
MTTPDTAIRLVEHGDAEALTAHLVRDAKAILLRAWRKGELGLHRPA